MKTRIIPAIDLIDGKCVRLRQGNFNQVEVVDACPVTTAKRFERLGFTRLHLVDLTGAKQGAPAHLGVLQEITAETNLSVDYSGGIRTIESVREVLKLGAAYVVIGSAAVERREEVEEWIKEVGSERCILGFDLLEGTVRVSGWTKESGLSFDQAFSGYWNLGIRSVMSTDISKDGMMGGPGIETYREILSCYQGINLIASGGVRDISDLKRLRDLGVGEVIVGKALYSGSLKLDQAGEFIW
jgi:phosphoribosylformimino-5-aminoimidazole carboxamide ribotide isomerase